MASSTKKMSDISKAEWVLRIAVAGEFLGHGVFALQGKEGWLPYFETFGIGPEQAISLLFLIGVMDLFFAALVLLRPIRIVVLWMALWGLWTALLRPIAGEPVWDFVERFANIGAPLALIYILGWPKNWKAWWRAR